MASIIFGGLDSSRRKLSYFRRFIWSIKNCTLFSAAHLRPLKIGPKNRRKKYGPPKIELFRQLFPIGPPNVIGPLKIVNFPYSRRSGPFTRPSFTCLRATFHCCCCPPPRATTAAHRPAACRPLSFAIRVRPPCHRRPPPSPTAPPPCLRTIAGLRVLPRPHAVHRGTSSDCHPSRLPLRRPNLLRSSPPPDLASAALLGSASSTPPILAAPTPLPRANASPSASNRHFLRPPPSVPPLATALLAGPHLWSVALPAESDASFLCAANICVVVVNPGYLLMNSF
jgi:hypothetical protein